MKIKVLILSILLFISTSLIKRSEICCMFSATRYYGWPNVFITVTKTTETLKEAKKVETESLNHLLENGWKMRFGSDFMGIYSWTSVALLNLLINMGICYLITLTVALVIKGWGEKNKLLF